MNYGEPTPMTIYRGRARRNRIAVLLLVIVSVTGFLGYQSLGSLSPVAASVTSDGRDRGALGRAGGAVPDGTTVFDDGIPGVGNLDSGLLDALRRAAADAAGDGIEFVVVSGWRSPEYQEKLLHEAVAEYGSEGEAARWVATPETSPHVSGNAIDVGSTTSSWLSGRGAGYGLCQIYGNEPWHYELRSEAVEDGCPVMYTDPTHDPRMNK